MSDSSTDPQADHASNTGATLTVDSPYRSQPRPVSIDSGDLDLDLATRYADLDTLGQGGMGFVKLNSDRRIGRNVAIKRLHPQLLDDPDARARFLREAKIQAQLEHPAIVPVYDLGEAADGGLYFTMKRIKGRTLRDILNIRDNVDQLDARQRERFGLRRLLTAFSQICQAIAFAHSRGVIHRDLKPNNLMFGEHGEVYVLDWGIARLAGEAVHAVARADQELSLDGDTDQLTRTGTIVGTLGYMAPEQATAASTVLDARADVWSLGAILYELLTGERLVPRANLQAMLEATRDGRVGDPSRVNPRVPPELAELCELATARDLDVRLASAGALAETLERYLDGDRDAQLRRQKASEHATRARATATRAFAEDDLELRSVASRESSIALALDPDNREARNTLLELFTRPPQRMPIAAQRSHDDAALAALRSLYRESTIAVSGFSVLLGLLFVAMPDRWELWLALAASLTYLLLCVYGQRRGATGTYLPLALHTIACLSLLVLTRLFSPLLVIPALVTTSVMSAPPLPRTAPRGLFEAVGLVPVLGAGLLEYLGLWSPTMHWGAGTLSLSTPMFELGDAAPVIPILLIASAVPLLLASPLNTRMQQRNEQSVRDLHLHRWQLEQLVL